MEEPEEKPDFLNLEEEKTKFSLPAGNYNFEISGDNIETNNMPIDVDKETEFKM